MHLKFAFAAAGAMVLGATAVGATVDMSRAKPAQVKAVMNERHEGMEAIGKANKILHREADAASPDMAAVKAAAAQMNTLAQRAARWFRAGTGPEAGKTGAKAEIWKNPKDFAAKVQAFQNAARNYNAIAARGDVAGVKVNWRQLGDTCKACHDLYRADMH